MERAESLLREPLADLGAPPHQVLTSFADVAEPAHHGFVDTLGALGILVHRLEHLLPRAYVDALQPEVTEVRSSLLRAIERGVELETRPAPEPMVVVQHHTPVAAGAFDALCAKAKGVEVTARFPNGVRLRIARATPESLAAVVRGLGGAA